MDQVSPLPPTVYEILPSAALVELETAYGSGLSARRRDIDQRLADHERDPEATYQAVLNAIKRGAPGFFPFQDDAAYLESERRGAAHARRRGIRAEWVQVTDAGRQAVNPVPAHS